MAKWHRPWTMYVEGYSRRHTLVNEFTIADRDIRQTNFEFIFKSQTRITQSYEIRPPSATTWLWSHTTSHNSLTTTSYYPKSKKKSQEWLNVKRWESILLLLARAGKGVISYKGIGWQPPPPWTMSIKNQSINQSITFACSGWREEAGGSSFLDSSYIYGMES
jgi:hypothetical protein